MTRTRQSSSSHVPKLSAHEHVVESDKFCCEIDANLKREFFLAAAAFSRNRAYRRLVLMIDHVANILLNQTRLAGRNIADDDQLKKKLAPLRRGR